jgi:hypothetical protein
MPGEGYNVRNGGQMFYAKLTRFFGTCSSGREGAGQNSIKGGGFLEKFGQKL